MRFSDTPQPTSKGSCPHLRQAAARLSLPGVQWGGVQDESPRPRVMDTLTLHPRQSPSR